MKKGGRMNHKKKVKLPKRAMTKKYAEYLLSKEKHDKMISKAIWKQELGWKGFKLSDIK